MKKEVAANDFLHAGLLPVYKPLGYTPLQAVRLLQSRFSYYKDKKIGYAGRLDPMAEGVLLLLVGEENKNRKNHERLPKEYVFEIVWGMETDSYDILGIVRDTIPSTTPSFKQKLSSVLPKFTGKMMQLYPPYSSPRIKGKSLFYWARQGKLKDIKIPKKTIEIFSLNILSSRRVSAGNLQTLITNRIKLVTGEFRQPEILDAWRIFFEKNKEGSFLVTKVSMRSASGTYVRSLVCDMGRKLGVGATTLSIIRTKVGDYNTAHAVNLQV